MNTGKTLRLRSFFRHKRSVIIPMDHPMYGGPVPGLEDPLKTIQAIANTEADGILVSPWVLNRAADVIKNLAVVARLDGGNSKLGKRVDEALNIAAVDQVLRYGAQMVAINVFIGGENEATMLLKLGDTAAACEEWGIPLLAEMIPATSLEHHFGRQEAQDTGLFDSVSTVARMGAEYGGDLIKTIYSGNQQEFASVVANTTVPILVAGGPKSGSDAEFLSMVRACMDAGAAGVTMGRNIWGRPKFEGMIAALCAIVHDDASVAEALQLL